MMQGEGGKPASVKTERERMELEEGKGKKQIIAGEGCAWHAGGLIRSPLVAYFATSSVI